MKPLALFAVSLFWGLAVLVNAGAYLRGRGWRWWQPAAWVSGLAAFAGAFWLFGSRYY